MTPTLKRARQWVTIVALLLALPIIGLTISATHDVRGELAAARAEADGVDRIVVLHLLYEQLVAEREGTDTLQARAVLAAVASIDRREGDEPLSGPSWRIARDQIRATPDRGSEAGFAALVASIGGAATTSGVAADDDTAIDNLADAATYRLVEVEERFRRIDQSVHRASLRRRLSVDDRLGIASIQSEARILSALGIEDVVEADHVNGAIAARLRPVLAEVVAGTRALDDNVRSLIHDTSTANIRRVDRSGDRAIGGLDGLIRAIYPEIQRLIALRVVDLEHRQYVTVGFGVASVFGLWIVALFALRAIRSRFELTSIRREAEQLESQVALARAEARFRTVFEGAALGIVVIDRDGTLRETNAAFEAMLGFKGREIAGKTLGEITDEADREETLRSFRALVNGEIASYEYEKRFRRKDGSTLWADVTVSYVAEEDEPFAIAVIDDVSDRVVIRDRLIHEATHDALTGLPNRALFAERLQEALHRLPHGLAVAFIDLDHFKVVNDSLGHVAGDALLRTIGKRLRTIMRDGEVVARFGGDEFAVMLLGDDIEVRVEWLQATIAESMSLEGRTLYTTASVGVAYAHEGYRRAEDILRDADIALYRAKADGRNCFTLFDEKMHDGAVRRLQITSDLRLAANEPDQFRLAFQPIVRLADSRTTGYEALIRWQHPRDGLLAPDLFIPVAEETGLISRIGRYVLAGALERLARERRVDPALTMHVNVSVQEIIHGDLPKTVFAALADAGVPADALTLEITEHAIIDSSTGAAAVLERLRAGGVRVCIDDFGIGYSSLRYLSMFPITGLKIDRSFVSGTHGGLASAPIVRMLLDLARSLELTVVAEGIETMTQADALRMLGCDFGQGYVFSPPILEDRRNADGTVTLELAPKS